MKKVIIATFSTTADAERAIVDLQNKLSISPDNISYVYRNPDGTTTHETVDTDDATPMSDHTDQAEAENMKEGAEEGAIVGGSLGALAGIATFLGVIPVIGPIFAAGPIVTALGLGTGALGTTAAGALTGTAAGGLVGALMGWGVTGDRITSYEEDVNRGHVLVMVNHDDDVMVADMLSSAGASDVHTYSNSDDSY